MKDEITWWFPSEEEKEKVTELCSKCIDVLSELPKIEQKAFALVNLVKSFEDVSGMQFDAIVSAYEESSDSGRTGK